MYDFECVFILPPPVLHFGALGFDFAALGSIFSTLYFHGVILELTLVDFGPFLRPGGPKKTIEM